MMMAMISPSRREVSPAEQLCQSPRLVPPRGGGVSSCLLAHAFFQGKSDDIAEDGRGGPPGVQEIGARPIGGAPPVSWTGCGPRGLFLLLRNSY